MIKEVKMYSVVCDRCGKSFIDDFNGIVAWLDEGTAKEQAMESEWIELGDKHYCQDCYEFDEKFDEYFPKKRKEINMAEFKVGERFILPDGNDGHLIEVQERDRHSLCDGCFFNDFICMNRGFGYCDFERRSDHKNVIFKEVKE